MAKVCFFSDYDVMGSGYLNIAVPLCQKLSELGHDVKAIALNYQGQEHWYNFSMIPARDFNDFLAIATNLQNKWNYDVFITALDIPHHEKILSLPLFQQRKFKYIGIMALEAGPLCISWAMVLMAMDKAFIISEYGAEQARQSGVQAEHIQVGIDTNLWRVPTAEEKHNLRASLGINEDTFVVLTVADNQERKNPHRLMETYAEFSQGKKTRYILVTREWNPAGARLRDYAQELKINQHFMLFERGMPINQLWGLYAISNVFLLASKSEGLGMPLLEAMATKLPVVATNCTAISELLGDNRGLLVDYNYQYRDCFGNGWRYQFDAKHGVSQLNKLYEEGFDTQPAREYVEKRNWDIPANQLDQTIKGLLG